MGSGLGMTDEPSKANERHTGGSKLSVSRNATTAWDTSLFSSRAGGAGGNNTTTVITTTSATAGATTAKTPDEMDNTMMARGLSSSNTALIDEVVEGREGMRKNCRKKSSALSLYLYEGGTAPRCQFNTDAVSSVLRSKSIKLSKEYAKQRAQEKLQQLKGKSMMQSHQDDCKSLIKTCADTKKAYGTGQIYRPIDREILRVRHEQSKLKEAYKIIEDQNEITDLAFSDRLFRYKNELADE